MADRVQEYLYSVPIVTKSLLVFNIAIHILIFLFTYPLGPLAIVPNAIFKRGEYYRIITSTYVHGGVLHILMNMSSLLPLGTTLESKFGSWKFLMMTLWSTIMCGTIYVFLAWLYSFYDLKYLHESAVGFSGVLFCYALIESFHSNETSRSVFGFFSVPTKAYPIILLIVIQIIMPNISLFGHLGGIVFGLILISRFGNSLMMPSDGSLIWLDQLTCCNYITRSTAFIGTKDRDLVHPMLEMNSSNRMCAACSMFVDTLALIWRYTWNVLSTALHIIGFPVDSCTSTLSRWWTAVARGVWSAVVWLRALVGLGGASGGSGGEYELVSTTEPVEGNNGNGSATTSAASVGRVLGRGAGGANNGSNGLNKEGSGKGSVQV